MADVDIECDMTESRTDETGEIFPSPKYGEDRLGNQTEESKKHHLEERTKLTKDYVKDLYKKISENIGETPEEFHYDYFKLEDGELYYRGKRKPLTTKGVLKSVGMLADILGKGGLRNLGFDINVVKVTARQAVMLNKAAEELPSESDITGVDDRAARNCRKSIGYNFSS